MTDPVTPALPGSVTANVTSAIRGSAAGPIFVKAVIADVSRMETALAKAWPAHKVAMVGTAAFVVGQTLALIFGW